MAVRLLQARFGHGPTPEEVLEIAQKKDTWPQLQESLEELWRLDLAELQRRVRVHFPTCVERMSQAMQELHAMSVAPLLALPVHASASRSMAETRLVARSLKDRDLVSVSETSLKIAAKAHSGTLEEHPMVQGLLLALLERAERNSRGVPSMRHFQRSVAEDAFYSEACLALALAGGNQKVFQLLGLSWAQVRMPLTSLHSQSLPDPFCAFNSEEVLSINARRLKDALPRPPVPCLSFVLVCSVLISLIRGCRSKRSSDTPKILALGPRRGPIPRGVVRQHVHPAIAASSGYADGPWIGRRLLQLDGGRRQVFHEHRPGQRRRGLGCQEDSEGDPNARVPRVAPYGRALLLGLCRTECTLRQATDVPIGGPRDGWFEERPLHLLRQCAGACVGQVFPSGPGPARARACAAGDKIFQRHYFSTASDAQPASVSLPMRNSG